VLHELLNLIGPFSNLGFGSGVGRRNHPEWSGEDDETGKYE
jgi:hypothetical protein